MKIDKEEVLDFLTGDFAGAVFVGVLYGGTVGVMCGSLCGPLAGSVVGVSFGLLTVAAYLNDIDNGFTGFSLGDI